MTIRLICLFSVGVACLGWTSVARAYEGDEEVVEERAEPTTDRERPDEKTIAKQKPSRRSTPLEQLRMLERLEKAVLSEMGLDEEHRDAVAALFEMHLEQVKEAAETYRGKQRESRKAMRELVAELREAREDDDSDRLAEIREELAKLRREGRHVADLNQDFFKNVKAVLEEEDSERFDALVKRYMTADKSERSVSIRDMQAILERLELSEEQREAIKPIFVSAKADIREFRDDPDKVALIQSGLEKALLRELSEEQVQTFQAGMSELRKRAASANRQRRRPDTDHSANESRAETGNEEAQDEPVADNGVEASEDG